MAYRALIAQRHLGVAGTTRPNRQVEQVVAVVEAPDLVVQALQALLILVAVAVHQEIIIQQVVVVVLLLLVLAVVQVVAV